jgi:hypothetical protein
MERQYPGSGNTFTVTFEKPGTYDYLCVLHPWMTGNVSEVIGTTDKDAHKKSGGSWKCGTCVYRIFIK